DFFVKSLSLVIEIDGRSHNQKEEQDRVRHDYLESLGLYVYRIKDADIRNDLNSVIEELERFILHRYATPRPVGHRYSRNLLCFHLSAYELAENLLGSARGEF
ncbi:MAG: DUF559 domain-containing protein, partial [Bacteroidota bacterium]